MRKLGFLIAFISLVGIANAQLKQNVYFLKNDGKEAALQDSADFIRIITEPESGAVNFKLIEIYPNEKKKAMGEVSSFNPLIYEGPFVSFYPNGKQETRVSYLKNKRIGLGYEFHPNGKLKAIKDYDLKRVDLESGINEKFMFFADSAGNELIKDGNGHFVSRYLYQNTDEVAEEGDYKDGLKTNTWALQYLNKNWSYKEQYEKGKLISGESLIDGVIYHYNKIDQQPDYKGGMDEFYLAIQKSIRFPNDASQKEISGKVFLSFEIEKDGSITNIKLERSLFPSLDREAIRVLRYASEGKWISGRQHGIPVKVKYNIPISFTITPSSPAIWYRN
jgi:TonB family protein